MVNLSSLVYIAIAFCSFVARAEQRMVLVEEKPLFGMSYDIAFKPSVDKILHADKASELNALHRASLVYFYPYNCYLSVGFSIDYTLALSPKQGDPRLDVSRASSKISSTFLGVSPRIRPQIPFTLGQFDGAVYVEAQLGLATSSPIAFGTQPLSDYTYQGHSTFPTPFPLMFETTPKIGVEIFAWHLVGIDVACGYRSLWVVHPMVSVSSERITPGMEKDSRKAIWYDVIAPFVQVGINMAF